MFLLSSGSKLLGFEMKHTTADPILNRFRSKDKCSNKSTAKMSAVKTPIISSLTGNDLKLLDYMNKTNKETGYPPSMSQMISFRGCTGEIPITRSLNRFRTRGLVDWNKKREYLQNKAANIPIVGKINSNGVVIFGSLNTDRCLDISMIWIDRFFALETEAKNQSNPTIPLTYIIFERNSRHRTSEGYQLRQIDGKTRIAKDRPSLQPEIARTVGSWEKVDVE